MNIISKVSTGKASLFTTYWFIFFPIAFVIKLADEAGTGGQQLLLILLIPFLWSLYGVWRCAFNVRHLIWGYVARGLILVNVLLVFAVFFASMANEITKPHPAKSEDVRQQGPSLTLA
jgi:hypothetical protein